MGMNLTKEQLLDGEYYSDYVEETGAYHIFHTESGFSPECYGSEEEAELRVSYLNGELTEIKAEGANNEMGTKLKEGLVVVSPQLPKGEWLVISVWEKQPMNTIGNRRSSYENAFEIIRLNDDGVYEEDNEKITISTCYVYRDSINEDDIEIVGERRKTYI